MTEREKELCRIRSRRYIAKHKAECYARHKAWADAHKAYLAEYQRKRRAANPEHEKALKKARYHRDIALTRKKKRDYRKRNLEQCKAAERRHETTRRMKMMTDAAYYAKRRATHRITQCKAAFRKGRIYRPRFQTRIPDWMTYGKPTIDARSPFLIENLTKEQTAFIRNPKEGRRIH